ncbi:MAG: mechanosensitive ion channel domain-containing protein [Gemmatimonadota bacterium]
MTIGGTPVTLTTIVVVGVILLVAFGASRLAQGAMTRALALRGITDAGTIGVSLRLTHYAIVLLGFGIGLQTLGLNLGALFTAGAFFAVALGFAMQNIAQNFVAGILLLTERTIKPGDVLEVENRVVRVTRMGLRATVARSRDEEDLIIPNATLVQNTVTNFTLRDPIFRLRATVGVSYDSDLVEVKRVLQEAAAALPGRLSDRDPRVLLTEFADSAVTFEVLIWSEDPWNSRVTRSNLNEAIWWAFKRAGIVIAYPQMDVHFARATPLGAAIQREATPRG